MEFQPSGMVHRAMSRHRAQCLDGKDLVGQRDHPFSNKEPEARLKREKKRMTDEEEVAITDCPWSLRKKERKNRIVSE